MIKVTLTEDEILNRSNDFDLGEFVRNRYWQERRNSEGLPQDDEHVILNISEDGTVTSIGSKWVCSICGEKTNSVDIDYLVGFDHLSCKLKVENSEFDPCVICGRKTPYTKYTHIDHRIGYVEGGGQGCYQPSVCERLKDLTRGLH